VEKRWGEGAPPGGREGRDRGARWEGVGEVDRGEADAWAHERVVALGWRRNMKDDECGRSKYKGDNMSGWSGIFRFEGEDKGE
jgi:hypothetical protein